MCSWKEVEINGSILELWWGKSEKVRERATCFNERRKRASTGTQYENGTASWWILVPVARPRCRNLFLHSCSHFWHCRCHFVLDSEVQVSDPVHKSERWGHGQTGAPFTNLS